MSLKLPFAFITALGICGSVQATDIPKYVGVWKFNSEKTLTSIRASKDVETVLTDVRKYGEMLLYPDNSRIMFTPDAWGYIGSIVAPEKAKLTDIAVVEINQNLFRFRAENRYTREVQELVVFFEGKCIYWPHRLAFNYYFCLE